MQDIIYITPVMTRLGLRQRLFGVSEQITSETDRLFHQARQYTEAKDWPEALSALTNALTREPCNPSIHCLIGDCPR